MKYLLFILILLLLLSCAPKRPHTEYVCTSSHVESTITPMLLPDGNGGTMIFMSPGTADVCDYGYVYCANEGVQVDAKLCK